MNEGMTGPSDTGAVGTNTGSHRAPERVIVRLRPHARRLLFPSIMLIVLTGATTFGALSFEELWQQLAIVAAGLGLIILFWALPMMRWLATSYVLTTRRLIIRRGLAVRNRQELLHSRGYDVALRQAGLQSLFRSGDVLINTGLDRPVMLRDVPQALTVQGALSDLMETSTSSVAAQRRRESADPSTGEFSRRERGR